jgi:hypothetical protein
MEWKYLLVGLPLGQEIRNPAIYDLVFGDDLQLKAG